MVRPGPRGQRRTYAAYLAARALDASELAAVRRLFERQLMQQTVDWTTTVTYLTRRVPGPGLRVAASLEDVDLGRRTA